MIKKIPVERAIGAGYPETDINVAGVKMFGRYPAGTGKKVHADVRGAGAATRGRKFLTNPGETN